MLRLARAGGWNSVVAPAMMKRGGHGLFASRGVRPGHLMRACFSDLLTCARLTHWPSST